MAACIDEYGNRFKVGPICKVLSEALDCGFLTPRGYRMFESWPVSRMRARHEALARDVMDIHAGGSSAVYGYRKVWHGLVGKGWDPGEAGRDQVMDIMRGLSVQGVRRGKTPVTTRPAKGTGGRPGLVDRRFEAEAPNRPHVAGITYVRMADGRFRVYRIRHRHVRQADRGPGVRHHHEHGGAAPCRRWSRRSPGPRRAAGPTASPTTAIMACGTPARCTPPG